MKTPIISHELLSYLRQIYPLQSPSIDDSDREIWLNVGIQTLINHLAYLQEKQNKRGEINV